MASRNNFSHRFGALCRTAPLHAALLSCLVFRWTLPGAGNSADTLTIDWINQLFTGREKVIIKSFFTESGEAKTT